MNCLIDLIGCGAGIVALMFLCNECIHGKKKKKNDKNKEKTIKPYEWNLADDDDYNARRRFSLVNEGIWIPNRRNSYRNRNREEEEEEEDTQRSVNLPHSW